VGLPFEPSSTDTISIAPKGEIRMSDFERKNEPKGPAEALSPDNGFPGLRAIPSISLLGDHDGIMDDDLFDLLDAEVERKAASRGDEQ
jgi:hypothetical protein